MEYDFHSVFIDLILTALLYCSVPLLSVVFFKSLSKKVYKLVCILWPSAIFLAIQWLYTANDLGSANMPAAFIWGFLSYKVGIHFIKSKPSSSGKSVKITLSKTPPDLETWYTCPRCGSLVHTGANCDCGFSPDSSNDLEVQEIVETYVQPIYPSYGSKVDSPRSKRVSPIFIVLFLLAIASSVIGWAKLFSCQSSLDELRASYSKLEYNLNQYQSRVSELILEKYGITSSSSGVLDREMPDIAAYAEKQDKLGLPKLELPKLEISIP